MKEKVFYGLYQTLKDKRFKNFIAKKIRLKVNRIFLCWWIKRLVPKYLFQ